MPTKVSCRKCLGLGYNHNSNRERRDCRNCDGKGEYWTDVFGNKIDYDPDKKK